MKFPPRRNDIESMIPDVVSHSHKPRVTRSHLAQEAREMGFPDLVIEHTRKLRYPYSVCAQGLMTAKQVERRYNERLEKKAA